MPHEMKAIRSKFEGILYRSRTEAKWAVFFKQLNLRYEYEREPFVLSTGPYTPDFWLPDVADWSCHSGEPLGYRGLWVEVKGDCPTPLESDKCRELAVRTGRPVALVAGWPSDMQHGRFHQYFHPRWGVTDVSTWLWRCAECAHAQVVFGDPTPHLPTKCPGAGQHTNAWLRLAREWMHDATFEARGFSFWDPA